jgi:SAM-dependent methyltransferase
MQNKFYKQIDACRLCASRKLAGIIDFGYVPLGNNLKLEETEARLVEQYPLKVLHCKDCGHFQLSISVDPIKLYANNYTYLSGVGAAFRNHFRNYASWAAKKIGLRPNDFIVDIGSNDGSCLKEFKALGYKVLGIDPASAAATMANETGIETVNDFFNERTSEELLMKHGYVDFVTSHNVLAHVEDLKGTFENIHKILKVGGYFCFEVGYFRDVLEKGYFDTIYHEHLDYHHASPLVNFLTKIGFSVLEVSTNEVQGGTLRILAKKCDTYLISEQVQHFLEDEKSSILNDNVRLASWGLKIDQNLKLLSETVRKYKDAGKRIVGYGAPTKATLLLKSSAIRDFDIECIIEDNILKVGRYLPGSGLKITDFDEIYKLKPEVFLILAWNFEADICEKLCGLVDWPATVIVPLPTVIEKDLK